MLGSECPHPPPRTDHKCTYIREYILARYTKSQQEKADITREMPTQGHGGDPTVQERFGVQTTHAFTVSTILSPFSENTAKSSVRVLYREKQLLTGKRAHQQHNRGRGVDCGSGYDRSINAKWANPRVGPSGFASAGESAVDGSPRSRHGKSPTTSIDFPKGLILSVSPFVRVC